MATEQDFLNQYGASKDALTAKLAADADVLVKQAVVQAKNDELAALTQAKTAEISQATVDLGTSQSTASQAAGSLAMIEKSLIDMVKDMFGSPAT